MNNFCNCDYDYLCENCENNPEYQKQLNYKIMQMHLEYQRYCIKDENGELIDVRETK